MSSRLVQWRERLFYMARATVIALERPEVEELRAEVEALAEDNERLRNLISRAVGTAEFGCPWCHSASARRHHPSCGAFTPEGEVR